MTSAEDDAEPEHFAPLARIVEASMERGPDEAPILAEPTERTE